MNRYIRFLGFVVLLAGALGARAQDRAATPLIIDMHLHASRVAHEPTTPRQYGIPLHFEARRRGVSTLVSSSDNMEVAYPKISEKRISQLVFVNATAHRS